MSEKEVKQAERQVDQSSARFENSMQHLQETIEDSSRKVSATVDKVQRPIIAAQGAIERAKQAARRGRSSATLYAQRSREAGIRAYGQARTRMQPAIASARERPALLYAGVALFGTLVGLGFYLRSRYARTPSEAHGERIVEYTSSEPRATTPL